VVVDQSRKALARQLSLPSQTELIADEDYAYLRSTERPTASAVRTLDVVDLFSGCGGLTLGALEGARRCGVRAQLALAVDHEPTALAVFRSAIAAAPSRFKIADLEAIRSRVGKAVTKREKELLSASRPALLVAGPPCQGHSALNNHTRHDDPRNSLYLAVARAAEIMEPSVIIIENVRSVGSDRARTVDACAERLEQLGYHVTTRRLNLAELGAPQRRVRHVLVASTAPFRWLLPVLKTRTVRWAIEDILEIEGTSPFDTPSRISSDNETRIRWLFRYDKDDLPNRLRPECHQGDHSYRSMYGRLRWDEPAQTITSGFGSMGQGRYVHPSKPRTLTPHEAARLQFIPDFVHFDGVAKRGAVATMIGNVAPPILTIALTKALIEQQLV
jgi:DNA (cytosine-5)-methyltransferase 1